MPCIQNLVNVLRVIQASGLLLYYSAFIIPIIIINLIIIIIIILFTAITILVTYDAHTYHPRALVTRVHVFVYIKLLLNSREGEIMVDE